MAALDTAIVRILRQDHPQTARGVAYRAESAGLIEKTDADFEAVGRAVVRLRRRKVIPFSWISDNTRWIIKPTSFTAVGDALRFWADNYRRAVWADQPIRVELWVEKDAIASLLHAETGRYDVPIMVCRGYPSHSLLYSTAEQVVAEGKPTIIYYCGDRDPSGVDIQRFIEEKLAEYVKEITPAGTLPPRLRFERIAVTAEQIVSMDLTTRPTKQTDTRAKRFSGASADLETIPARTLRAMVRDAIERHISPATLAALELAEESERWQIRAFADETDEGKDEDAP